MAYVHFYNIIKKKNCEMKKNQMITENEFLHDVEISNYNNIEEITITADTPLKNHFHFSFIILLLLFFPTIFFSFSESLRKHFQVIANTYDIISTGSVWTHNLKPKIENISPQMSSFLLTIILSTPISKDINIKTNSLTDIFNKNTFLKFKPYLSSGISLLKNGQQLKFLNMTFLNSKIIDKILNGLPSDRLNRILYFTKDEMHFVFDSFFTETIVFDSIQADIILYGKVSKNEKITIISKTKNPNVNLFVSAFRAICSIILISEVIYSVYNCNYLISLPKISKKHQKEKKINNSDEKNSLQSINIEILMTVILTILSLLYIDPLFLIHYYMPSSFHLVFKIAFRDLFFSYLFFYSIEIFNYFERRDAIHSSNLEKNYNSNEKENKLSWYRVTSFISSVVIFAILFVQDTKIQTFYSVYPKIPFLNSNSNKPFENNFNFYSDSISESDFKSEFDRSANRLNVEFNSLNIWHFIFLAISAIILPIKIFSSYSFVKKTSMSNRYIYYSVSTLSLLILLITYSLIKIKFFTSSYKTIPVDHFYSQNVHKLIGRRKVSTTDDDGDYCFVNESFFCSVFPMVLFTIYVALMARGHRSIENVVSESDQYISPNDGENSLNADVDELKSFIK